MHGRVADATMLENKFHDASYVACLKGVAKSHLRALPHTTVKIINDLFELFDLAPGDSEDTIRIRQKREEASNDWWLHSYDSFEEQR